MPGEGEAVPVKCLATFGTTSMTLLFERTCRKNGISAKVVPVPRKLSASCGLACEFPCEAGDRVRELCAGKKIDVESFHEIGDGWT